MALEQTNDAKYKTLGVTYAGAIDDRMRGVIDTNAGRSGSEYDHWKFLYPAGVGTLNDIKRQYFLSLGIFTADIQSMENRYWELLSP